MSLPHLFFLLTLTVSFSHADWQSLVHYMGPYCQAGNEIGIKSSLKTAASSCKAVTCQMWIMTGQTYSYQTICTPALPDTSNYLITFYWFTPTEGGVPNCVLSSINPITSMESFRPLSSCQYYDSSMAPSGVGGMGQYVFQCAADGTYIIARFALLSSYNCLFGSPGGAWAAGIPGACIASGSSSITSFLNPNANPKCIPFTLYNPYNASPSVSASVSTLVFASTLVFIALFF